MQRALFIAPFDELSEPAALVDLALLAEDRGWDGFFLWDHVQYPAPVTDIADPWVALAAIGSRTEVIRIGALVTPLARRRPWVLARQLVTLDRLSRGRLILGLGVGGDRNGEMEPFGEEPDIRVRAAMLEEGLDLLSRLLDGVEVDHDGAHYRVRSRPFLPRPMQEPRIPVWLGARWPARRPILRAARWDGVFPIGIDAEEVEALRSLIALGRPATAGPITLVTSIDPAADPAPWESVGVDWLLTELGPHWSDAGALAPPPSLEEVRAIVSAGPA